MEKTEIPQLMIEAGRLILLQSLPELDPILADVLAEKVFLGMKDVEEKYDDAMGAKNVV